MNELLRSGDKMNFFSVSSFGKIVTNEYGDGNDHIVDGFPSLNKVLKKLGKGRINTMTKAFFKNWLSSTCSHMKESSRVV